MVFKRIRPHIVFTRRLLAAVWMGVCVLGMSCAAQAGSSGVLLHVLTWEGYTPADMVARFEREASEKYQQTVTLRIRYASHPDEYFESIRNDQADVIAPSHNILKDERYQLISRQLILPINTANIPNYRFLIPSLQYADYTTEKGQVYSVPLVHGPYELVYDADVVTDAPDSWAALWDERFHNQYAISYDYFEANIYIAALSLGIPAERIADMDTLHQHQIEQRLKDLVTHARTMWLGVDRPDDLQGCAIAASWGFPLAKLNQKRQHWKVATPKEGVTGWLDGYALTRTLRDRPLHRHIAEDWINFSISKEYQYEVMVKQIGSAPVNTEVASLLTPDEISQYLLDQPDAFKSSRILWPTLNKRERNYFRKLWDDALGTRQPTPEAEPQADDQNNLP
ncbi:ABC transporter substrate-binding protein [Thalassolituus sp. LLYu03]|uniref:ABC transporter substrate-binding protein n=1 Tax=Thalassolituus sp. LLYu03 TaxID=3421656 RepID=UPI003D2AD76B